MNRAEQIEKRSKEFERTLSSVGEGDAYSFAQGAEWADRNPKENKPIEELSKKELEKLIDDQHTILRNLHCELKKKLLENYNFENKFILVPDYGYMYVTWQTINKDIESEYMFLQGIAFTGEFTPYQDANYFSYSAMTEWNIPMRTFEHIVKNIKIIEEKEFFENFTKFSNSLYNEFYTMLNSIKSKNE